MHDHRKFSFPTFLCIGNFFSFKIKQFNYFKNSKIRIISRNVKPTLISCLTNLKLIFENTEGGKSHINKHEI